MTDRLSRLPWPGGLLETERRDVGGALAMVTTGIEVTLLWIGGLAVLELVGVAEGTTGFILFYGLLFAPAGLLAAFLVGFLLWRYAHSPTSSRRRGAILGGATALASYVGGGVGVTAAYFAGHLGSDVPTTVLGALGYAGVFGVIYFGLALVLTGWLVVPLGAWAGWCHERSTDDSS